MHLTVDFSVVPGFVLLVTELLVLAAVGFVVARVGLRERHDLVALAQGMVIGLALWGLAVNFILYLVPGLAGALIGWGLVLALGGALAWRGGARVSISWRRAAGFAAAALALFWVMLAARQLMKTPDPEFHLGLSAYVQAGGWPPATSWNPGARVYYHYGVNLLVALLDPPAGPNSLLVTEVVGAYIWTSFALVVATALLQRGGWRSMLLLSPLMLTAGAWTLVGQLNEVPHLLQIPAPTDLGTVGLRSSLAGLYWPDVAMRWHSELDGAPANIWKPPFVLAYALAFVVLWHAAASGRRSRMAALTLALLVGFLGLVSVELALLIVGLWVVLESIRLVELRTDGRLGRGTLLLRGMGPVAAVLLLAVGGGSLTGTLAGAAQADISLGWIDDPLSRDALGRHELLQGRIGLLGVGALSAALGAALLAWRDRLVLALAASTIPLMGAALTLEYPIAPHDVTRFDGHARNFALLALLLATAVRLPRLPPIWRMGASAAIAGLVVWPTIAQPVRTMSLGVSRGVQLANSETGVLGAHSDVTVHDLGRYSLAGSVSDEVSRYVRDNTTVDTRVFSAQGNALSVATGRPNASGLRGALHLRPYVGEEYDDVARFLEPEPVRRLGLAYLHGTADWIEGLPAHARRWLDDPQMFEPVVRTEWDVLFRIRPAFLELRGSYAPGSYEALRQAAPPETAVYLAPSLQPQHILRVAAALSHTQVLGTVDTTRPHLLTGRATMSLTEQEPDLVVVPARLAPSVFEVDRRRPVWWNEEAAVYAPTGAIRPIVDPPRTDLSVVLADVRTADTRIAFTATFTDRATERWQGQDWVVVRTDDSPWRLPYRFGTAEFTEVFARWFDGQLVPVPETATHEYFFLYEFEPRTGTLALWDGHGYRSLSDPQGQLASGSWMLAARPNVNREEVGLIPVLQFTLADDGSFTIQVYEGSLDAMLVR